MKKNTRTIYVSNLGDNIDPFKVRELFNKVGPLQKCFLTQNQADGSLKGAAIITFMTEEDATKAVETYNKTTLEGHKLLVKFLKNKNNLKNKSLLNSVIEEKHKIDSSKKKKRGRLVIRNLSYQVTEEKLREYFEKYGAVKDVCVLKYASGRLKGVAFVEYEKIMPALKAIKEYNMKSFMGRQIAVDLAVPKNKYEQHRNKIKENTSSNFTPIGQQSKDKDKNLNENESELDNTDNKMEEDGNSDDENDEVSDEEFSNKEDTSDDNDDELSHINEDSKEDNLSSNDEESDNETESFVHNPVSKDVLEGKTIFIRNISFSSTEDKLEEILKEFGEMKYVMFCKDHSTQRFKGSAFAQFMTKEGCDACLEAFEDPVHKDLFKLDGRSLNIMKALGRNEVKKITDKDGKGKDKPDKRNLYLAREGVIREGTKAADGVSKSDLLLRTQREIVKRKMIANYNIYISPNRLCIHNIPLTFNDKELLNILKKYSPKGSTITECRIMRNLYDLDENGKAKSKGFAFVTFKNHQNALSLLRNINNNPEIFTAKQRPVVEFSLENKAALKAKENRLKKSISNNKKASLLQDNFSANEVNAEETTFIGAKYDPNKKGKAALSSHIGPKIRHRDRGGSKIKKGKITRNQINNQLRNERRIKKRGNKKENKKKGKSTNKKFKKAKKLKRLRN